MPAPENYGLIEPDGLGVAVAFYRTHEGKLIIEITDSQDEDVEVYINSHAALADESFYGKWNSRMIQGGGQWN